MHPRSEWKSRTGFLLAAIGSAVGLGNIWRFPYVAYKNGGGAFFIPYFIALFMIGIPLLILEQGLGNLQQGSAPLAYARIRRRWEFLGWWVSVFIMFGLTVYYNVVLSWCLNYLALATSVAWGPDTQSFFNSFLGSSATPLDIRKIQLPILIGLATIWFVNWFVISREIKKGIEIANKIAIPLLFLLLLIILIWSAMLPGASGGIKAYLTPDMSRLLNPQVWSDAFGQIFFTLSLGSGTMIVFASYLPAKAKINDNAVITASTNSIVEILAGFAVFSIIGYMALKMGRPVSEAVSGGPGLAFVAYPQAINMLPFGNNIFGVFFFSALVLAGITSSVAMIETFIGATIDKFGWHRKKVAVVCCITGLTAGVVFTTNAGLAWLDIVDHMICNVGMLLVGFFETILIAWIFGGSKFAKRLDRYSRLKFGPFWTFCVKIFIPLALLVLFAADLVRSLTKPYGGYPWSAIIVIGVGWMAATLVVARAFTRARWKTDHLTKRPLEEEEPMIVEVLD